MTATEELRRMLDERGVEWGNVRNDGSESNFFTEWQFDGIDGRATATEWSAGNNLSMAIYRWGLTPAQAIDSTLGPAVPPPPPPDQPPYDELLDILASEWGIDASWDGLRRFWCVELNDEGVRKRDERDATLGRGTCHNAMPLLPSGMPYPDSWMCSECGGRMDGIILETGSYCPNCGRKVVEE